MRILLAESWSRHLPRLPRFAAVRRWKADRLTSWRLRSLIRARLPIPACRPGRVDPTRLERHALRFAGGCRKAGEKTMFNLEWLRARGVSRGEPGLLAGRGRRLAVLGLLFASSLLQTGCQSGPSRCGSGLFGPCGFFSRTSSRIMRPFRHGEAAAPCGTECAPREVASPAACPMETMTPGTVIMPGATMAPGTMPSNQLSAPAEVPSNLEPLPRTEIGPAPSGTTRRTPSGSGNQDRFQLRDPASRLPVRPVPRRQPGPHVDLQPCAGHAVGTGRLELQDPRGRHDRRRG